ncbi:NXPE family member 4-like [Anneissia japonica]|uniref:NXPE family member 4-like n=1 Tax=Anneissia japonica TaxID=1529436 RepID=UPI0014254D77|nr:NXPE family member 4-like [Anneissia japonica]XP_033115185.1 NXPE family member 4-like [Anneissia japonica]XP_033115186.1 NXPE family member 4-like [Anneissia japonica]XP_033115187.1 NXPE family member 4-like [Anneissia japonica]XP_033115188.1 NXPE family member 4-like [Anneissia japonica]XP_033115189.1 NXPE family member 4-like [Anneissia japonica]XP_033115190.1 NXPE family member 4-like [Anneissia japonica]XP_033115191.1 NXPE family member 4-like [Anneissia japonica]
MTISNLVKYTSFFALTLICCLTTAVFNWDRRLVHTSTDSAPKPMFYTRRHQDILKFSSSNIKTSSVAYTAKKSDKIFIPTYQSVKDAHHTKYTDNDVTEKGNVGMIDGGKTLIALKNADKHVKVGDFFSVIIEARDSKDQHRVKGGDFLFATIRVTKGHSAGKIIDFNNGTYEVIFFAAWAGKATIEITVVHSSETVDYIESELWSTEQRIGWNGNFRANSKKSEHTLCRFTKVTATDKCVYSHPRALGKTVFLCDKPVNLSCETLFSIKSSSSYVEDVFSKLYTSHRSLYDKSVTYARLTNGISSININSSDDQSTLGILEKIWLPECKPDMPIPLSDGFWTGSIWTSLQCKAKQWTGPEIIQCIKEKQLIFMGDSTTRQWAEGMLELTNVTKSIYTSRPTTKQIRHHSDIMTFDFYFHPYSIGSVQHRYRVGKWEYEVLDNLNSSACNYVIMVSPWAHYSQWTKESVIERLRLLRETLIRFMKRCPNAQVLMKTPHPRNHKSKTSLLYSSDKILYDIYELYYKLFSGLGIHIIDIWDMNLAYPHTNTIHMPMKVIYQELFLMFSHICTGVLTAI